LHLATRLERISSRKAGSTRPPWPATIGGFCAAAAYNAVALDQIPVAHPQTADQTCGMRVDTVELLSSDTHRLSGDQTPEPPLEKQKAMWLAALLRRRSRDYSVCGVPISPVGNNCRRVCTSGPAWLRISWFCNH